MKLIRASRLKGKITIPEDESVSHHSVTFDSVARGITEVYNYLQGAGCLSTIACFWRIGVETESRGDVVLVHSNGVNGLKGSDEILDCDNSGTIIWLISGILASRNFDVMLTNDGSVQRRPMKWIMEPLVMMGADI